ncbi:MAG: Sec-independent protein translocase protein TatB [Haliea sp.]|uniref:Sec-independent protein translocase protein TatB n=1 Tax=Haliea sp. TaxID=1932666 RepID=UPI0032EFA939
MFDIGFTELVLIAVVSLLVIGPERLPGAIRTAGAWLHRIKRGFNDIRQEVEQELHNDSVLQELRKTRDEIKAGVASAEQELKEDMAAVNRRSGEDADSGEDAAAGTERGKTPASGQDPSTP